jgi:23S rRNA pseudouridine2605 synthase
VLSKAGICSRTEARSRIHARRVRVNGRIVENPDVWIDFENDRIHVDGKPLEIREKLYILLNKPAGYITTYKDPEKRPTVYDLIPEIETFVSPVGRLDLDTSGLLIMTNDTQLAERLTNPDRKVAKTYEVECEDLLSEEALDQLRKGIVLNDGPTKPAQVRRLIDSQIEIKITEGRNRQVRRMIEASGTKVLSLQRTAIGPIKIEGLKEGNWRNLTHHETEDLRR